MNKTVLELKNICLSYNGNTKNLLNHLSFSLCEGEVLSIIGRNGTGKSSLLRIITGIEKRYSGELIKHTKKISYVPQKIDLEKNFPLNVKEFFHIFNDTFDGKILEKITALFSLEKLLSQNIHSLSGGEFQKILIANALISKPELLILDEPTSGIDVIGEELFYEVISKTKEIFPKLAIVLVSHNLRLVYKNSSHVICLHDDNFCCHGTPAELSKNPDITKIFGEYLSPYEHHPHKQHHHIH